MCVIYYDISLSKYLLNNRKHLKYSNIIGLVLYVGKYT